MCLRTLDTSWQGYQKFPTLTPELPLFAYSSLPIDFTRVVDVSVERCKAIKNKHDDPAEPLQALLVAPVGPHIDRADAEDLLLLNIEHSLTFSCNTKSIYYGFYHKFLGLDSSE